MTTDVNTTMSGSSCLDSACNSSLTSPDLEAAERTRANDDKALYYIPVMVYVSLLMVIGVIGNILVVYVYRRRFKKTSSNYFILTMAIFDLVACLIGMPTEIYDLRYPYAFFSSPACKIFRFTETFTIYGSAVILVEIAFDRYFKICRPLREINLLKIKVLCFVAVVVALVLSAPTAVMFGITRNVIPGTSITGYDCSIENKYSKSTFQTVYYGVLMLIFLGTLFTLSILYIKIWLEIRHRKKLVIGDQITKPLDEDSNKTKDKKKIKVKYVPSTSDDDSTNNNNNSSNINNSHGMTSPSIQRVRSRFASLSSYASRIHVSRTTIILFAVTVAFLISYLPAIVIMIIRSVVKDIEQSQSIAADVTSKLFSKFFLINNAINPIIYSFLNVNFRRQAKIAIKKVLCFTKPNKLFTRSPGSDKSTRSSKSSRSSKKTLDTVM